MLRWQANDRLLEVQVQLRKVGNLLVKCCEQGATGLSTHYGLRVAGVRVFSARRGRSSSGGGGVGNPDMVRRWSVPGCRLSLAFYLSPQHLPGLPATLYLQWGLELGAGRIQSPPPSALRPGRPAVQRLRRLGRCATQRSHSFWWGRRGSDLLLRRGAP